MRLERDEFFGHEKIKKMASQIAKKTKSKINNMPIRDPELIKILVENIDWLDYIGFIIKEKDEKTLIIKWEIQ
jgi:hypothetical protein